MPECAPLVKLCEIAVLDLPETTWCLGRAIKAIPASLTGNTANLKISITHREPLGLRMPITSLRARDWALYLEILQPCLLPS